MTNPLVSIIVPVYNAQKGLSRCLESICSQTYQELEIIVLNDGSTDDSLAICEQFRAKDPRIVVVDKENEGVSRTRNAGLTLAQGDYIQFADSDDALDPDYTQNLVQAALQHNADLVIAPYWMVIPSNSSKTGHALETLQTSLGIEPGSPQDRGAQVRLSAAGRLQPGGLRPPPDAAARLLLHGVLWNNSTAGRSLHRTSWALRPMCTGPGSDLQHGVSGARGGVVSIPEPDISSIQTPKASVIPRSTCAAS